MFERPHAAPGRRAVDGAGASGGATAAAGTGGPTKGAATAGGRAAPRATGVVAADGDGARGAEAGAADAEAAGKDHLRTASAVSRKPAPPILARGLRSARESAASAERALALVLRAAVLAARVRGTSEERRPSG